MAVTAAHLTTGGDSAASTTYTTAPISPNSQRLLLAFVQVSIGTAPTPSVSLSGCGVTWTQVASNASGTSPLESRTLHVFRAMGDPSSGALTITTSPAATACMWHVVELAGVNTSGASGSGAVAQSVTHRSDGTDVTSITKAFDAAVASGNSAYAAVALHSVQEALTAGSGWTSIRQQTIGGPQTSLMGEFAATAQQNVTASWTTPTDVFLVGVEVVAGGGDTAPPSVPAGVTAVADSSTQVTVSWSASTDDTAVASYRVKRDGTTLPAATAVVGTSFVDTTVSPATAHTYTVSAVDAAGNRSAESVQASVATEAADILIDRWDGVQLIPLRLDKWDGTTLIPLTISKRLDNQPPTTPTSVTATAVSSFQIDLTWTASLDPDGEVDGYVIRRDGAIIEGSATGSPYSDTGLSGSTTYTYTVQGFDDAGNHSAESTPVSATTPAASDTTPPSTPTGLTATVASSSQIDLSWTASTDNVGVARYIVYRNGAAIASNVTGTTFLSTGLASATSYSYRVQAADAAGNVSALSGTVSATTQPPPVNPPPGGTPVGDYVIGLTAAQIQALPRSGTEWNNFKRQADGSYANLANDGNTDGSGNCVAGALMYVATGNTAYRNRVLAALQDVENTPDSGWWHAAVNRKMGGWALAGHLIGHETASWHNFLRTRLTYVHGDKKSSIMHKTAWQWDNNHGGAAQSSYAVICAILGLTGQSVSLGGTPGGIYHLNKWLRGFCGDHTSTGFPHVNNTNPPYGAMGITMGEGNIQATWQHDASKPYGIVPSSSMGVGTVLDRKEGAVPSDVHRGGGAYPDYGADARHYVYGNAGRRTVAAVVLAAMGYPEIWEVGDRALYRWRANATRIGIGTPEGANNQCYDPIINAVYGSAEGANFPATSDTSEILPATEWLALDPDWPVRPSSLP